jgi:hypothetical protein
MTMPQLPKIEPYTITTYKWTRRRWKKEGVRMNFSPVYRFGTKAPRVRPCWWNNGVENIQAVSCPEGYVKGKLRSPSSVNREIGCRHCGRVFYSPKVFKEHPCLGAK